MKTPEHIYDSAWVDEHIEKYLDGELPLAELRHFEMALAKGPVHEDLQLARRIQVGLHALPQPLCPPHIIESVVLQVQRERYTLSLARIEAWLRPWWGDVLRPALAMGVLTAIVLSAAFLGRTPAPQNVSQAEVEQALAEAKWALAYVSHVGLEASESVRHVLDNTLADPDRVRPATIQPD